MKLFLSASSCLMLVATLVFCACRENAFASELNQKTFTDRGSCANLLVPKNDTDSFVNLLRFVVLEKKGVPTDVLEHLARSELPTNPIQKYQTSLSEVDAHSTRLAFDRLIAQGKLSWDVIRAEAKALIDGNAQRQEQRAAANEKTAPIISLAEVQREPIAVEDLYMATWSIKFTTRGRERFVLFVTENTYIVNTDTGATTVIKGFRGPRQFRTQFYEKSDGQLLVVSPTNKDRGVAVYDARTGKSVAEYDFRSMPEFAADQNSASIEWQSYAHETSGGELELLVVRKLDVDSYGVRIRDYKPPMWINTKTDKVRPVNLERGDYEYFTNGSGSIVAFGRVLDPNVTNEWSGWFKAFDLARPEQPLFQTARMRPSELNDDSGYYRASDGRSYIVTYDYEGGERVVKIHSEGENTPQQHPVAGWFRRLTFVEYGGKLYLACEASHDRYQVIDVDARTTFEGTAAFDKAEVPTVQNNQFGTVFGAPPAPMSKTIEQIPDLGLVVVSQQRNVDDNTIVLGFYKLLTGETVAIPFKDIRATTLATFVTKEGWLRSLYKDDKSVRFVQLYGPVAASAAK